MSTLKPGDKAPNFTALNQKGEKVKLSDYRGRKKVALLFYPMDFSPVCTEEHCAFGPAQDKIAPNRDTVIFGVNCDHPFSHAEFKNKFNARFKYVPDHNGIKGYTGVYAIAYATKKFGKFDSKAVAKSLHGMTISPKDEPGILLETTWDDKGDIDRISYIAEVVNGKQTITSELPKLGK